jgi:hypothetical protein
VSCVGIWESYTLALFSFKPCSLSLPYTICSPLLSSRKYLGGISGTVKRREAATSGGVWRYVREAANRRCETGQQRLQVRSKIPRGKLGEEGKQRLEGAKQDSNDSERVLTRSCKVKAQYKVTAPRRVCASNVVGERVNKQTDKSK